MKIKNQFLISIAIFIIVLAAIAASIITTEQQTSQLNSQEAIAGDIQNRASGLNYISNDYFLYQNNADLGLWQTQLSALSTDLAKLNSTNNQQEALINNVNGDLQNSNNVFTSAVSFLENAPRNESVRVLPEFQTEWSRLAVQNQALAFDAQQLTQNLRIQVDQSNFNDILLIAAFLGLFGIYFITNYLITYRNTLKSIYELQKGIAVVGSGNLDYSLKAEKKDEISEIASSFNQMTANLKNMTASKAELELAQGALVKSEQRWATTLSSIGDAVIATNVDGKITFMNKIAESLTAFSLAEAIQKPLPEIFHIINEETRQEVENPVEKVLQRGAVVGLANHSVLINKQGREIPIDDSGSPIRDKNGQVTGVVLVFHDITERKRAEAQIVEQLHMLDLAHVIVKDMKDEIIFWNSGAQKLYGFSKEEALGKVPHVLLKTVFPKPIEQIKEEVMLTGKWEGELVHTKADGSKIIVASYWVLHKDHDNQPVAMIETNNDISERKKAEERLAKSEERWSTTLSSIGDSVIATDVSGSIIFMNAIAEELTGWTLSEALGKPIKEVFHIINEETRQEVESPVSKVLEKGMIVGLANHTILVRKDRSEVPLDDSGAPIKDEKGNVTGVVIVFHDITERKEMEQKLEEYSTHLENLVEERTKKLELSSLYARNLIEASLDPLVTISKEGKITDVNKATEDVTGCSREELVGSDFSDYFTEPKEARAGYRKVFTEGLVKDYPLSIRHKSGKITDVLYNASIYRNSQGEVQGVFAAARDITDRIRAEQRLKDAERLANIGATAGMVGHDIRNPLQAITGDVYLAKSELAGFPDSEEKKSILESLEETEKNVEYINKIVADLQDFARPLHPRAQESNMKAIVEETMTKNGVPKNIKVSVKAQNEAQLIKADPDYLKRIVGNLVLNAIQAMPEGGKLSVRIFKDKQTGDALLTIEDTGVGIPDDVKGKLFTPMFTTKSKGQGFGLAVVKRMTEALGGTVTFESEQGKGTKFIVRLPHEETNGKLVSK